MTRKDLLAFAIVALVQCVLITLRLIGAIAWHWGYVFSPVLFIASIFALIVAFAAARAMADLWER